MSNNSQNQRPGATLPSLTPHTDAVKRAVEDMRVTMGPAMASAGQDAVLSRITFACASAAALAMAHEGDLNSRRGDVFDGVVNAVANMITQSAMTLFEDQEDAAKGMLAIGMQALRAVKETASGAQFPGPCIAISVQKMGEA